MPDRVRLTVPSETRSLALVESLARRWCEGLEIPEGEAAGVSTLVRDAVEFTLRHAYPDDPSGEIQLTLDLVDRDLHVEVHDWGLPLASAGGGLGELPSELATLAERADDLRLVNLGADGKRVTFRTAVSTALDTGPDAHDYGTVERRAAANGDVRDRLEICDAQPGDAERISQLLYANYHLSYGHPDFYRPRWVEAQLRQGTLLSSLAVLDGEVIGHHAVMLGEDSASAETGAAVVHPAFRGLGIFTVLADHSTARAEALALEALWGRAVTVHPFSQRAALARGYRETGVMLGSIPARMEMAGIDGAAGGKRTASILSFRVLHPSRRCVSLPGRYRAELIAAYANVGLETGTDPAAGAAAGEPVTASEEESRATAVLTVSSYDEAPLLHAVRRALARHVDVVYADLDLTTGAASDEAVERLNAEGFFYAGLVLCGRRGHDFLRLQLLNAEDVELERIVCDSAASQEILRAVVTDRGRVER